MNSSELTFNSDPTIATISTWDFNTSLGDTLHEKYESLFIKIIELREVLKRKFRCSEGIAHLNKLLFKILEKVRKSSIDLKGELKLGNLEVQINENIPNNRIVIECDGKKAVLEISNLGESCL